MDILGMVLSRVVPDPFKIGFVSFTRSARREAASRAADRFGIPPAQLEKHGWFRTLHSCCYRMLGVAAGELLTGTKEDNDWLRSAVNDPEARIPTADPDDEYLTVPVATSDVSTVLSIWSVARNRLTDFEEVYDEAAMQGALRETFPMLETCKGYIDFYESAKRRDGRLDFTDLLLRFGGRRYAGPDAGPEHCDPDGDVPPLPVWMHDEAQDMSALTALVFQRLCAPAGYVYLFGDDWQAIYGWAGSDGSLFADWKVDKEEVLPVSYRCPSKVLAHAQRIMRLHDFPGRDFRSVKEGGSVDHLSFAQALETVRPGQDTLVLARTNQLARRCSDFLDNSFVPWRPTKGQGGFAAPARAAGVAALETLRRGGEIDGEAVWRMLDLFPAVHAGDKLFPRGTKKFFSDPENRAKFGTVKLGDFEAPFPEIVSRGKDLDDRIVDEAALKMARAARLLGPEAVLRPTVRVGTCHSAKGMEADHVVALNRVPYPTERAMKTDAGMAEECKLWYVTASRAKESLVVADDGDGPSFPDV
jgi:DNA helicase-2/ATP-dependent DNA helicase PcrA